MNLSLVWGLSVIWLWLSCLCKNTPRLNLIWERNVGKIFDLFYKKQWDKKNTNVSSMRIFMSQWVIILVRYYSSVAPNGNQSESTECEQNDLETKMYRIHLLCVKVNSNCVKVMRIYKNCLHLLQVLIPAFHIHLTGKQGCCANRCGVSLLQPWPNRHFIFSLKFINIYNPSEIQLWRGLCTGSLQAQEKWCICHL